MSFWPPTSETIKELKRIVRKNEKFPRGWRTKTLHRVSGDLEVFINPKMKLIVKAPSVLHNPPPSASLLAPTIQLGNGWVVQPLCTFENRAAGFHELVRKVGVKKRYLWDLHLWNVGRFNGKPVFFDW